jgi:chromosome segregation ATPase
VVTNERQTAQIASTLAWLEDNVRDTKAQIGRLGQQVEQAQTHVWDLANRLHRTEEATTAVGNELVVLPGLETQISSIGDRTMQLEDRQSATDARLTEAVRQQQLEVEHLRAALNELVKRVDGWERLIQHWAPRFDVLEDVGRRSQEATAVVRQRVEEFERHVEHVEQRAGRTAEGMRRYEQDLTRINLQLEDLYKRGDSAAEKIDVHAELFKRLEDAIAAVGMQTELRDEFTEKLDLLRSNVRRTEERLNAVEANDEGVRGHLEEHERAILSVDSRERLYRERLGGIQEEIASFRAHVAEQFHKAQLTVERQRRRRIEEMEREIRKLKVNGYRPPEEH